MVGDPSLAWTSQREGAFLLRDQDGLATKWECYKKLHKMKAQVTFHPSTHLASHSPGHTPIHCRVTRPPVHPTTHPTTPAGVAADALLLRLDGGEQDSAAGGGDH